MVKESVVTPTGGLGKPVVASLLMLLSAAWDSEIFHGALQLIYINDI